MVEVEIRRSRAQSDVLSEKDLEKDNCILCFNEIKFFAMGECDHKNVCARCVLRIRLIMEDDKCSICKTECDEIVVSANKNLTWNEFERRWKKKAITDKEDDTIYYEDVKAKAEGMKLRTLSCLIKDCQSRQVFPNVDSLRQHMESNHEKTFCKICLKGRTVFIRE